MTTAKIQPEISIILPCLNEEDAIEYCLNQLQKTIQENKLSAEIIIVDNNSTDKSAVVVKNFQKNNPALQITLVSEEIPGYGSAYQKGFSFARGEYIFMSDIDGTYDFGALPRFIRKLRDGSDIVVGNRFGNMTVGSMPWHHRYIGNPLLSSLVRYFFGVTIRDIHCGARAIRSESLKKLELKTQGMEFASEMIIKSARAHLSIAEIPITYTGRIGVSKLKSFRDGWRHLRFILLYSPLVIFLIPGSLLFAAGTILMTIFYFASPTFFTIRFYIHPLFIFSSCIIVGYQLIFFAIFAKTYAIVHMKEKNALFEKMFKYITIEKAGIIGLFLCFCGILIYFLIFYHWIQSGRSALDQSKNALVALTLIVLGVQTTSSAFILSIIGIS